jgi:hypothetical protein
MLRMDLEILRESIISKWASSVHNGMAGMPSGFLWPFSSHLCLYLAGRKWECTSIFCAGGMFETNMESEG